MKQIFYSILLIITPIIIIGQETEHDHNHNEHKHHIGVAMGPVYVIHEKEFSPGLHLHYARLYKTGFGDYGLGLGLEAIFDKHRHYAASFNFSYLPIHNLTLTVAPGIQFGPEKEEFTTHFEVSYEFEVGEFHLGPVAEYAYAKDDAHMMLGLHVGFGF